MERLIIGEGSLNFHEVAMVMEKSTSFAVLQTNWRSFAQQMISEIEIPGIQLRVATGLLQLKEVPREVLKIWKADQGSRATLKALCEALGVCGLRDIADALHQKFTQSEAVTDDKFMLHGKVYDLEQLVRSDGAPEIRQSVCKRQKLSYSSKPIPLLRNEFLPREQPEYYISRTFLLKTQLDEQIFSDKSAKDHIFVVKGAPKSELARVSEYEMIGNSRFQLQKITSRFIMLECEEDFKRICCNTTAHMIEYKNNNFFWLKSTQSLDVVRNFLKEEGNCVDEKEAILRIASHRSNVTSVADSPGMGKTFVLTKLATSIRELYPNAIVLFVVLQELAKEIYSLERSSALDCILRLVCTNHTTKLILQQMMSNSFQLFFFFDGYDEVLQEELKVVDSFLQNLAKIPTVKLIVATRPHLQPRLENNLITLSYEILPFTESNQIEFLIKYWITKHGAMESETLLRFAKKCLTTLKMKLTDNERDIAGIPLQCMMLAEVYAEEANRASEVETLSEDVFDEFSFFYMYKSLINLKLRRIPDLRTRQMYMDAHVYESTALLFPEWLEKFEPFLTGRNDIDENTLYSIGLLEKVPSSGVSRFVHRTFAEYVLADFLVRNLTKSDSFVDFLFHHILGGNGVTKEERIGYRNNSRKPDFYKFQYPVIAYFLNMHLHERFNNDDDLTFIDYLDLKTITAEDVCIAVNACSCNDLDSCINLVEKILQKFKIKDNGELKERYFKHILHLAVENTNNVLFVQKILNLTRSEFGLNLSYHVFEEKYIFGSALVIPDCTPLHVAAHQGKYNIVIYLLQEYGRDIHLIKHLLHVCAAESAENKESIIEEKLAMIESLVKLNCGWVEEEHEDRKPLLQSKVHLNIIKKLVKLGADINAYSKSYGTILHTGGDKTTYTNLVRWALNNSFTIINHSNSMGETPLMAAVKKFDVVDNEVFKLLHDAGANLNAEDLQGNSILLQAIQMSRSYDTVLTILDLGANPNHINNKGQNAADIMKGIYKYNPSRTKNIFKLLLSRGFHGSNSNISMLQNFNTTCESGDEETMEIRIFKILLETTAKSKDTILYDAITYFDNIELVRKILEEGTNFNRQNCEIVFHYAMIYKKNDLINLVKLLQTYGFNNINEKDINGATPVMSAAITGGIGDDKTLQFLHEIGVDFLAQDYEGNSLLFYAIQNSKTLTFIEKILDFGANPNHRNALGRNAAHLLMLQTHHNPIPIIEVLKLLKSRGFDGFNKEDIEGHTPLLSAVKSGKIPNEETLQFLYESGADFNAQDEHGDSVLFYCIQHSANNHCIRKLLDYGADVNHRNSKSQNAAHYIIGSNKPKLAVFQLQLLESKGFHGFNETDSDGNTPLELARNGSKVKDEDLLEYLQRKTSQ